MRSFEKSILINCSLDELYDFHTDVNNIKVITPKDIKVELLNKDFNFGEGKKLKIRSTKFCLPTIWEVEISLAKKPSIIVDSAIKSPFSFWRHSHKFSQKGGMCQLVDVIEYEMPFGFLGNLVAPFIEKELNSMFTYRQKITKEILEKRRDI